MHLRIQRTFLGWDRPALLSAAEVLVEEAATGDDIVDLTDRAVVLPGARAGRRLLERLLEMADRRGLILMPPQTLTVGGLPELFYESGRAHPPPLVIRRAWADALASLDPDSLRILMAGPPAREDHPTWFRLAGVLEGLHTELGGECLTFADVADRCGEGLLFDDEPRWRMLARIQEAAMQRLDRSGWEDRGRARIRALDSGILTPPDEVWLIGLSEMPRIAREFVARASGRVRVLVHAPPEEADAFELDGTLKLAAWDERDLPLDAVSLHIVGGPGDQADLVLRELAAVARGRTPEEVVVGVADPQVVPYLRQRLDRAGVPNRVAAGTPFVQIPPHRLLHAVATHLTEGRAETFASLVRHPDLTTWLYQDGVDPGAGLRALDRYRERSLPARVDDRPLEGELPDRNGRRSVEMLRRRVEEAIGSFRAVRPLADWIPEVTEFLYRVYGHHELREDRREDRALLAFLTTMGDLLESANLDAGVEEGALPGTAAMRILADLLDGASVPPPAEENAVEILDWLEIPMDDAPFLILTGVNDPHLPSAVVGDPFLPDSLRSRLGIRDNRSRRARDAYLLRSALASRGKSTLLAGRRGADGEPLRPSRLLLTGGSERAARRILAFLDDDVGDPSSLEGELGELAPAPPQEAASPGAATEPSESPPRPQIPPEPVLPLPPGPMTVRISSLKTLLGNPYLWVIQNVMRLDTVEDGAVELSPLAFGSLLHRSLEVLGRELQDELDRVRIEEGLVARLRRLARETFGSRPLPSVQVQLAQMEARLIAAARVEAESRAEGWRTVGVEARLPAEGVAFPVDGREFRLTGTVDRVDRHRDGRWRILDYKTGEKSVHPDRAHRRRPRGADQAFWVDLQLPLYRQVAGHLAEPAGVPLLPAGLTSLDVGYFVLPRSLNDVSILMADWTEEELEDASEAARGALRQLAGSSVTFDPTRDLPEANSPLSPLMGVGLLTPMEEPDPDDADDE